MTSTQTSGGTQGDVELLDLSLLEVCTEHVLPRALQGRGLARAIEERSDNVLTADDDAGLAIAGNGIDAPGMAVYAKKLWKPGRTLRVRFLDDPPSSVRQHIEKFAHEWEAHAHIAFAFGNDPDAEIRITCTLGKGSWSYLGVDALTIHKTKPTMNFGWFTAATPEVEFSRTVLHEFGHALGCIHEHMHPQGGIPWNRDAAYRYYTQTQRWTKERVDSQLFQRYSTSLLNSGRYDPQSIMHYPVPRELTMNGFSVGWNNQLSAQDKAFIGAQYQHAPDHALEDVVDPMAGVAPPEHAARQPDGPAHSQLTALFNHNVRQLDRMNVAAAALVKGLIMELRRPGRETFIRLANPAARGHRVDYDMVAGDPALVVAIGEALGFKTVTASMLEVHSA